MNVFVTTMMVFDLVNHTSTLQMLSKAERIDVVENYEYNSIYSYIFNLQNQLEKGAMHIAIWFEIT